MPCIKALHRGASKAASLCGVCGVSQAAGCAACACCSACFSDIFLTWCLWRCGLVLERCMSGAIAQSSRPLVYCLLPQKCLQFGGLPLVYCLFAAAHAVANNSADISSLCALVSATGCLPQWRAGWVDQLARYCAVTTAPGSLALPATCIRCRA
jgi:hypothetical protein